MNSQAYIVQDILVRELLIQMWHPWRSKTTIQKTSSIWGTLLHQMCWNTSSFSCTYISTHYRSKLMKSPAPCPIGKAQQSPRERWASVTFQTVQETRLHNTSEMRTLNLKLFEITPTPNPRGRCYWQFLLSNCVTYFSQLSMKMLY